jgi:hypothetical protein
MDKSERFAPAAEVARLAAMWGRKRKLAAVAAAPDESQPARLKDALRKARVDQAERSAVVVDLQDAEVARLELLNEALEPVFAEIPAGVDLFDRGISKGDIPRLWIDAIAHVGMGRDKRIYRFVQDTRYGRKLLAESGTIDEMVEAVTTYIAQRLIERERALAGSGTPLDTGSRGYAELRRKLRRGRTLGIFLLGLLVGVAVVVLAAMLSM